MPDFVMISQTVVEIWQFTVFFKMVALCHLDLLYGFFDYPQTLLGGLWLVLFVAWHSG